ncbi:MAG: hypothetical protein IKT02_00765 [Bacteroidales bacterium]|nr:hypothetical protein [Bacteroidales bacterium]
MNKLQIFSVIMAVLLLSSCRQVDYGEIPEVVTFQRSYDLNLTSNRDLWSVNGSILDETVGYKGIIVFRQKSEGAHDDFVAYERACPNDCVSAGGTVSWEPWILIPQCDKCGAQFLILYGGEGWPIDDKQPTNCPLKQYDTYFDGRYVIVSH